MPDESPSTPPARSHVRLAWLMVILIALAAWYWRSKHADDAKPVAEVSWERRRSTLIGAVKSWQGVALVSDNEVGRFPEGPADLSPKMAALVADMEKDLPNRGPHVSWVPVRATRSESAGSGMHALMFVVADPNVSQDGIPRYYCTFVRRRGLFSERSRKKEVPEGQVWLRTSGGDWHLPLLSLNNNESDAKYHYKYEYEGNGGRKDYTLEDIMLIYARLLQDANEAAQ